MATTVGGRTNITGWWWTSTFPLAVPFYLWTKGMIHGLPVEYKLIRFPTSPPADLLKLFTCPLLATCRVCIWQLSELQNPSRGLRWNRGRGVNRGASWHTKMSHHLSALCWRSSSSHSLWHIDCVTHNMLSLKKEKKGIHLQGQRKERERTQ